MSLSDEHRQYLRDAAIADDLMASVTSAGDALIFRHESITGEVLEQRSRMPKDRAPGEAKYRTTPGQTLILPVPANMTRAVADVSRPLLIVEGTKGHLAAASWVDASRFAVVGMLSCWGWARNDGEQTQIPVPCLFDIPMRRRDVVVALDADIASNHAVFTAAVALETKLLTLVGQSRCASWTTRADRRAASTTSWPTCLRRSAPTR